ncbi:MAG: DedA family protein/thiosulfate sulfurtransferase GlpE [Nitrospira sp.]|nr:DedA family protein/thiosulfate sulfurtransferase GlpE [Nitrospira sp.]
MNEAIQFLTEYGLLVLLAVVFIEQIGLPLPAFPVLIAAGVLAATGRMSLWIAFGGAVAVTLVADWIWFELGRRQGRRVLDVLCRIALEPDTCVRRTEDFFIKHGPHSLMAAKFIPGLGTVAPSLAGIVGLSAPLFLFYDSLGAAIWAGSGLGIGAVFSDQFEQAVAYVERIAPAATGTGFGILVFYILYKAIVRRRQLRGVPRVTVEQLMAKLQAEEPPLLIDVRSRASAEAEPGIPSAVLMSLDELIRRHDELPRQRDVVLYCGCPNDVSSAQGTLLLHKQGFTRVWPLAGGIDAWRKHGGVGADLEPGRAVATVGMGV